MGSEGEAVVPGPEWPEVLESLGPGTVMLVGSPGAGKSHLARYPAEGLTRAGLPAALVSADMPAIRRAEAS